MTGNRSIPSDPSLHRTRILGGPLQGLYFSMPRLERAAFALGTYERHVVRAMAANIRPGAVAYDIGANAGYLSLMLAKLVGRDGRVFAFEPDARNLRALQANAELNGFKNLTPVPKAVSDACGTVTFASFSYSLVGHIARTTTPNDASLSEVEAITLDEFVYGQNQPRPDFLKIDVEGAEEQVLRGASRVLREAQPVILAEVRGGEIWPRVLEYMQAHGYTHQALQGGWRMETDHLSDVLFTPGAKRQ
jgi:FkbM family methyltransferase